MMAGVKRICARWLSLPEELLLRVLALLDEQELMTARLVCREWRQASLTYMTHLNLNAWLHFTGVGASTAALKALAKCWPVLPNLSNLTYRIESPDEALLLSLPSCASALKRLRIEDFSDSNSSVGAVAVAMAPIARLTGLTLFTASAPRRSSREAPTEHAQFILTSGVILAQCTRLCKVVLHLCEVKEWLLLLPFLAGLPHLQILGKLPLCNQEVVAGIARMRQLTSVGGTDGKTGRLRLQRLLRLPALRALDIDVQHAGSWPTLVRATTQGMVQLAQLAIFVIDIDERIPFGGVLGPLSGLTKLGLRTNHLNPPPLPHNLWQSSLRNLQELRWSRANVEGGGVALPISLRHLELELLWWHGPEMPGLLQSVAALTRLTALSLSVGLPNYGWTTYWEANAMWRAASFLTGLTRLVHLSLDHFLHVDNVEGDVESLAVLTGLRRPLRGSCSCHGGDEHVVPQMYSDEGGRPEAEWTTEACGFEAFETGGRFLRLLPLTGLQHVEADGPWQVLVGSRFAAEVNSVRRMAGRPSMKFGRLSELDVWPGWEGRDF